MSAYRHSVRLSPSHSLPDIADQALTVPALAVTVTVWRTNDRPTDTEPTRTSHLMSDAPAGNLLGAIEAVDSGDYADASAHVRPTV
jgi:hypothetical protein